MKIRFEPRDLWIGLYWTATPVTYAHAQTTVLVTCHVCIIPMFPIIFEFEL